MENKKKRNSPKESKFLKAEKDNRLRESIRIYNSNRKLNEPKLTQALLAEKVDVQPEYINAIINGRRPLSPGLALNISKVLNVRTEYLLGEDTFITELEKRQSDFKEFRDVNSALEHLIKESFNSITVESLYYLTSKGESIPLTFTVEELKRNDLDFDLTNIVMKMVLRNGEEILYYVKDMNILKADILDYIEFKIQKFVNNHSKK